MTFKINDRVRLKHDNKESPSLTVRAEIGGQRFLCISDCGQRMVWAMEYELEIVERNAELKQAIREVLLSDEFLAAFAKAWQSIIHNEEPKFIVADDIRPYKSWDEIAKEAFQPIATVQITSDATLEPVEEPSKWIPKVGEWVVIPGGRVVKAVRSEIIYQTQYFAVDGMNSKFAANTLKQWAPEIGEWVRIKKPMKPNTDVYCWSDELNEYDGTVVQVKKIEMEDGAIIFDDCEFMFEWLEPAEAPQPTTESTLNSDTVPEGYRKLKDSSKEPRQLGDLRWSVTERRYVEITEDEVWYANRDNWAACRKATGEVTVEVTGEVKPPDGWRFLERGEMIRNGDKYFDMKSQAWIKCITAVGHNLQGFHKPTIRRNRFNVDEKVIDCRTGEVYRVQHVDGQHPIVFFYGVSNGVESKHLAPYEDTK